jgi:hypothetical protein
MPGPDSAESIGDLPGEEIRLCASDLLDLTGISAARTAWPGGHHVTAGSRHHPFRIIHPERVVAPVTSATDCGALPGVPAGALPRGTATGGP